METNYIIILNYSVGEVIKIKLTQEQIEESEKYDDFEEFLSTLEEEYDFRLKIACGCVLRLIRKEVLDFNSVNAN